MGILEKLRPQPRWKHADPGVRAAAVYELGPDEGDALRLLAREDTEARVRRAAVTRLSDIAVLGDIGRTDPDEDVRAEAIRGLAGVAAEAEDLDRAADAVRQLVALGRLKEVVVAARENPDARVRASVVDLLDDPKSLGSVSRHAPDGATRLRPLPRLGFVIYPGKLSQVDCFRVGNIGRLYDKDMLALCAGIREVLNALGVPLPVP